jgi:hypothetical protein
MGWHRLEPTAQVEGPMLAGWLGERSRQLQRRKWAERESVKGQWCRASVPGEGIACVCVSGWGLGML